MARYVQSCFSVETDIPTTPRSKSEMYWGGYINGFGQLFLGSSGKFPGSFDPLPNLNVDFFFYTHTKAPPFAISLTKTMLDKHNARLL